MVLSCKAELQACRQSLVLFVAAMQQCRAHGRNAARPCKTELARQSLNVQAAGRHLNAPAGSQVPRLRIKIHLGKIRGGARVYINME